MLICERDGVFCIVRSIDKSGMSLKVKTYCGQDGYSGVQQLPDDFLTKLHDQCQKHWEETKQAAHK